MCAHARAALTSSFSSSLSSPSPHTSPFVPVINMWNGMEMTDSFGASLDFFNPGEDVGLSTFDLDYVDHDFPSAPSPLLDYPTNTTCVSGDPFFAPGPGSPPPPPSAFVQEHHSFVEGWLMDDDPLLDSAGLDAATTGVASDRHDSERGGAMDPVGGGDVLPREGGGDVLPHEGGGSTSSDSEADTRQKAPRSSKRQPPRSPSILLDKEPPPPVMSDVIHGARHPGFAAFTSSQQPSHVHHPQASKVHGAVPVPHRDHCCYHQERQLQDCPLFQPSSSAFSSQESLSQTTDDDWATAPTSPSKEGALGFAPHDAWPHACGDGRLDGPWQQNMEDKGDSRWARMSSSSLSSCMSSLSTASTSCPSSSASPLVHLTTDPNASTTTTARGSAQFDSACDRRLHLSHPHQSGVGHGRSTEEQEHLHHHKQQQRRDGEVLQQSGAHSAARASKEGEEEQTRILQHWGYRLAMRQHVQRQFSRLPALFSVRVCSHIPPLRPTPHQPSSRTASDPVKTSVSSLPLPSQPRGPSPSPRATAGSHRQRSRRANATRRRRRRRQANSL